MIIHSLKMEVFIIPLNWEIKPFDLKLINNLAQSHPYQKFMFIVSKYYMSYHDEYPGDVLDEIDYFELFDRYYRYGIIFDDYDLHPEDVLYVKEDFSETPPDI